MGYKGSLFVVVVALLTAFLANYLSHIKQATTSLLQQYMLRNMATAHVASSKAASSAALVSRSVAKKVLAVETPEGAGAVVRRSIGTPKLRNFSPFLMLDHFKVSEGAGFPDQ